ncbi:cytochrome c oxidase assembly protein [Pontibacter brevis]
MEMNEHATAYGNPSVWLPFVVLTCVLGIYLTAVWQEQKSARPWSNWRTVSFACGVSLLAVAMWPPLVRYAHHDLRGHMVQHLLIGMLAPLGLVLGAPLTVALRALPAKRARKVTAFLGSRSFYFLSHPVTALFLNIGGMYLLYLTPLYAAMLHNPYLHYLVHFHFLAAGYLFVWAIAGPDPAPRRPGMRLRLIVLFAGIASHAYLSKFMYAYTFPRNTPHALEEIQDAAKFMYYGGDLAELLLAIAFFSIWYRKRERHMQVLHSSAG